jgi:Bacterial regulatory proteins, lacI family
MPKTTISDVAKEAGVSTMTVSRVLNGRGEIAGEARLGNGATTPTSFVRKIWRSIDQSRNDSVARGLGVVITYCRLRASISALLIAP